MEADYGSRCFGTGVRYSFLTAEFDALLHLYVWTLFHDRKCVFLPCCDPRIHDECSLDSAGYITHMKNDY
jgi:hypothetical protein